MNDKPSVVDGTRNSRRYLESLDSVRNKSAISDPDFWAAPPTWDLFQTECEVWVTVMLGDQVQLSENQSFDSVGFLALGNRVLEGLGPASAKAAQPFLLQLPFYRSYDTYREMVASRFADPDYLKSLPPEESTPQITTTRTRLSEYFAHQGPLEKSKEPQGPDLKSRVESAIGLSDEVIEHYFGDDDRFRQDAPSICKEIRAALADFPRWLAIAAPGTPAWAARTPFHRRGFEYLTQSRFQYRPLDLFTGARALLDSSYNRVNADSVRASDAFWSPAGDDQFERLGCALASLTEKQTPAGGAATFHLGDSPTGVPNLNWSAIWARTGSFISDKDFRHDVAMPNLRRLAQATPGPWREATRDRARRELEDYKRSVNSAFSDVDLTINVDRVSLTMGLPWTARVAVGTAAAYVTNRYVAPALDFPMDLVREVAIGLGLGYGGGRLAEHLTRPVARTVLDGLAVAP